VLGFKFLHASKFIWKVMGTLDALLQSLIWLFAGSQNPKFVHLTTKDFNLVAKVL
jgi:hypothetical protein